MPLKVIPLTDELFNQAAYIEYTCFYDCPAHRVCFPHGPSPTTLSFETKEMKKEIQTGGAGHNPTAWHLCVIDEHRPGEILTYGVYYLEEPGQCVSNASEETE